MSGEPKAAPAKPTPTAIGLVKDKPVVQLLVYAIEKGLTGTFEFRTPSEVAALLTVVCGYPSKIKALGHTAYLGEILVDLGHVSRDVMTEILEVSLADHLFHGDTLVLAGAITEAQRDEALRAQIVRKLEHLGSLPQTATFAFYDKVDLLEKYQGHVEMKRDTELAIWRLLSAAPPWEHVERVIGRMHDVPVRLTGAAQLEHVALPVEMKPALELLNRQALSFTEWQGAVELSAGAAKVLFYFLLVLKRLERIASPESQRPTPSPAVARPPAPRGIVSSPFVKSVSTSQQIAAVQPPRFASGAHRISSSPNVLATQAKSDRPSSATAPAGQTTSDRPNSTPAPASARPDRPNSTPAPASARPDRPNSTPAPASARPDRANSAPAPAASGRSERPRATLTPEMEALRKEIAGRSADVDTQDYFAIFGIGRNATQETVRAVYLDLARRFHPDRLPAALDDVREACAHVFARINEANTTLVDYERRREYEKLLDQASKGAPAEDRTVEAAMSFRRAELHLRRGEYVEAEAACRVASEADPKNADYLAMLAWAESCTAQSPAATATQIAALDRAIRMNEECDRAFYYRGMLHQRVGQMKHALRDFKKAVAANPRNIEAARALRLAEMRR